MKRGPRSKRGGAKGGASSSKPFPSSSPVDTPTQSMDIPTPLSPPRRSVEDSPPFPPHQSVEVSPLYPLRSRRGTGKRGGGRVVASSSKPVSSNAPPDTFTRPIAASPSPPRQSVEDLPLSHPPSTRGSGKQGNGRGGASSSKPLPSYAPVDTLTRPIATPLSPTRGRRGSGKGDNVRGVASSSKPLPSSAPVEAPARPIATPVSPPGQSVEDSPPTPQSNVPANSTGLSASNSTARLSGVMLLPVIQIDNLRVEDSPPIPWPNVPANSTGSSASNSSAGPSRGRRLSVIQIEAGRLIPSNKCSRRITKIFKTFVVPDGYMWKNVTPEVRNAYFEKFKDPVLDAAVRKAWDKQAALRYSDLISKWKKNRDKRRPLCVPVDIWPSWLEYWAQDDVIANSERQRKNRMTEVDGPGTGPSRHTGGSRSYIEHSHALAKEKGRALDAYELFMHLHTKGDGKFVDYRSKKIAEEVKARATTAAKKVKGSAKPSTAAVDMSQLFVEVATRGNKRRRLYGLGSKAVSFIPDNANSHSSISPPSFDPEALRRQLKEEVVQEVRAEVRASQAALQAQIAELMNMLRQGMAAPPGFAARAQDSSDDKDVDSSGD